MARASALWVAVFVPLCADGVAIAHPAQFSSTCIRGLSFAGGEHSGTEYGNRSTARGSFGCSSLEAAVVSFVLDSCAA